MQYALSFSSISTILLKMYGTTIKLTLLNDFKLIKCAFLPLPNGGFCGVQNGRCTLLRLWRELTRAKCHIKSTFRQNVSNEKPFTINVLPFLSGVRGRPFCTQKKYPSVLQGNIDCETAVWYNGSCGNQLKANKC